jgi:hypothetical protein
MYTLTGEQRYRAMADRVGRLLVETQEADGSWHMEGIVHNDLTAELVVWLDEIHQALGPAGQCLLAVRVRIEASSLRCAQGRLLGAQRAPRDLAFLTVSLKWDEILRCRSGCPGRATATFAYLLFPKASTSESASWCAPGWRRARRAGSGGSADAVSE